MEIGLLRAQEPPTCYFCLSNCDSSRYALAADKIEEVLPAGKAYKKYSWVFGPALRASSIITARQYRSSI